MGMNTIKKKIINLVEVRINLNQKLYSSKSNQLIENSDTLYVPLIPKFEIRDPRRTLTQWCISGAAVSTGDCRTLGQQSRVSDSDDCSASIRSHRDTEPAAKDTPALMMNG